MLMAYGAGKGVAKGRIACDHRMMTLHATLVDSRPREEHLNMHCIPCIRSSQHKIYSPYTPATCRLNRIFASILLYMQTIELAHEFAVSNASGMRNRYNNHIPN